MKHKITILRTRPVVADAEVHRYMDFDSMMKLHQASHSMIHLWKQSLNVALGTTIVAGGIYLYLSNSPEPSSSAAAPAPVVTTPPDSVSMRQPETDAAGAKTSAPQKVDAVAALPQREWQDEKTDAASAEGSQQATPPIQYIQAEPLDGYPQLYSYFDAELRYPAEAIADSVQGTLSVSFVIDRDGKPTNIAVQGSLGPLFDKEAIRLIQQMPPWKPAKVNGQPIPAKVSLPLVFKLVTIAPGKKN